MDRSGSPQLTRITGPGRGPGVALAAAAVFLVLAILKPWTAIPGFEAGGSPGTGAGGRNPEQATGSGATAERPLASPAADTSDLERHCPQPSSWRVFAHERWAGGSVRSWKSLTPAREASGPLDPTIPMVQVTSQQIPLLGYCAPWRGPEQPPATAAVSVWRLIPNDRLDMPGGDTPAQTAELLRLQRVFPRDATILGALYAPPTVAGGPPIRRGRTIESWPAGLYVFGLLDGEGFQRWWAVEVVVTPPRTPTLSPTLSPTPTPG
jgi:hypothetical protein